MEHTQSYVCRLLQRHGFAVDQTDVNILDDTQEYEWVAYARDSMTDERVIVIGSDERFVCLKGTSLPALSAWCNRQMAS